MISPFIASDSWVHVFELVIEMYTAIVALLDVCAVPCRAVCDFATMAIRRME